MARYAAVCLVFVWMTVLILGFICFVTLFQGEVYTFVNFGNNISYIPTLFSTKSNR